MITQDLKDYFCRHFLGRVEVKPFSLVMAPPRVLSTKRTVETHPIRTEMKVAGFVLLAQKNIVCSSRGFRFAAQWVRTRGSKIARYVPEEIRVHTRPKLRAKVREGTKRVAVLPQERSNRLQWQPVRPKKEGEMILAWYGPLIEDAILKLTLNKQQGTLLIWYNPQSRRFDPKGIYLYRRLGVGKDFEWRWV
ncbi:MAG: hypothetical protein LBP21_03855 [Synergistaceae bacterium]|nr:hypothetical protein [Synergistaceae bacterium]